MATKTCEFCTRTLGRTFFQISVTRFRDGRAAAGADQYVVCGSCREDAIGALEDAAERGPQSDEDEAVTDERGGQ